MTHFVVDKCIKCKYTDCVEVCPVDCFYEGENMLVINPDECIDCGACVYTCPVLAIVSDYDVEDVLTLPQSQLNTQQQMIKKFRGINSEYAKLWPKITHTKSPMETAQSHKDLTDKEQFFSARPAGAQENE